MQQVRIAKHQVAARARRRREREAEFASDPRDPDIVRVKERQRRHSSARLTDEKHRLPRV